MSLIKRKLDEWGVSRFLTMGNLVKNLPFLFFLVFLMIVYIGLGHVSENTVRDIDHLTDDVTESRGRYMSTKNDLMLLSRESKVAEAVDTVGLKVLTEPPQKIVVTTNEY